MYEIVQKQILDMLEQAEKTGEIHWIKPWCGGTPIAKSYLADEHTFYKGVNTILNPPSEYISFKEVQKLQEQDDKIQIRKGCHTHTVYYFNFTERKDEDGQVMTDDKGNPLKIPFLKFYKVFNIDDVNGLESRMPYKKNEHTLDENMEKADRYMKIFSKVAGIDMVEKKGSSRAYYSPNRHAITVPDKEQYKNIAEYFSTCFHEISHAIDKMLSLTNDISSQDQYSSGELVAEISSQLIANMLMISQESSMKNSVEYIRGWSDKIKAEKTSYIVSMAGKASKACDYFFETVEKELEKYNVPEVVVSGEDKIIHITETADADFDYEIYKYDILRQKLKLLDGGIIEQGGEIHNVMDALADIVESYNIAEDTLQDVKIEVFEELLAGDIQYEDVVR